MSGVRQGEASRHMIPLNIPHVILESIEGVQIVSIRPLIRRPANFGTGQEIWPLTIVLAIQFMFVIVIRGKKFGMLKHSCSCYAFETNARKLFHIIDHMSSIVRGGG